MKGNVIAFPQPSKADAGQKLHSRRHVTDDPPTPALVEKVQRLIAHHPFVAGVVERFVDNFNAIATRPGA